MVRYQSWGRYPKVQRQEAISLLSRHQKLPQDDRSLLAFGNGRSYGDSCLNQTGLLVDTRLLKKFIHFDASAGILRCESGTTMSEIIDLILPYNWFLPVTPGTKFVTLGGAIANDVHGKNHHRDGCFGHFVRCFELLRSDGRRFICSPNNEYANYFKATIGGLGLTGLITWAEIELKRVSSAFLDVETTCYSSLDEFRQLSRESKDDFLYSVAWIDCMATGRNLGRGVFTRVNHCDWQGTAPKASRKMRVPIDFPSWALNRYSIACFNKLYYWNGLRRAGSTERVYFEPYFYPLDAIHSWNRIYGRSGFLQYQFVVPSADYQAIKEILSEISASGAGSFLAVLKEFGSKPSLGMLSFPRPGVCLALDFPNQGEKTLALLNRLDDMVMAANGAVYPAKDARMSGRAFRHYFPGLSNFGTYVDERFLSDFWVRVTTN